MSERKDKQEESTWTQRLRENAAANRIMTTLAVLVFVWMGISALEEIQLWLSRNPTVAAIRVCSDTDVKAAARGYGDFGATVRRELYERGFSAAETEALMRNVYAKCGPR